MKTASVAKMKKNLRTLLAQVQQGQTILIMDHHRPIARLEPVTKAGEQDVRGRLARLERAGLIRRGKRRLKVDALGKNPPRVRGPGVPEALLEERSESV
jgi:antitoxin (DNA-binding transcriptional repressor) of toxin-antitoxin stability system